MKQNLMTGILTVIAALLFLSGCATDYRLEAAENAKEYLLDNIEGLSSFQRNYIRYNDPVILNKELWRSTVPQAMPDAHIVDRHEKHTYKDPRRDMMMQCFAWRVPGMAEDLMVVGTAQRDFRYWSPDRIVLRNRVKKDIAGIRLQKKAMQFAVTALPELKGDLYQRVRFETPEVYTYLFEITQQRKKKQSEDWLDFLKVSAGKEPVQISAVWKDPVTGKCIAVAGTAEDAGLTTWRPLKAFELQKEDTKVYIGSKYTVIPDDSADPFSKRW